MSDWVDVGWTRASSSSASRSDGWHWREDHWKWRGDDPKEGSWNSAPSASWQDHEKDEEKEEDKAEERKEEVSALSNQTKEGKWVWKRPPRRLWVHIFLFKHHADFDLVPVLIGRQGVHMSKIFTATGAKLRIRGRGSGHLEVDGKKEAPVPLQVAVTVNKGEPSHFKKAVDMVVVQLLEVTEHYKQFCWLRCLPIQLPIFCIGEVSNGADTLIREYIDEYPHPHGPRTLKKVTPGGIDPYRLQSEEIGQVTPESEEMGLGKAMTMQVEEFLIGDIDYEP